MTSVYSGGSNGAVGRLSGLTCWENYMPLARYYLYSQGVDIWAAPTLAPSDGWIATMKHIARVAPMLLLGLRQSILWTTKRV